MKELKKRRIDFAPEFFHSQIYKLSIVVIMHTYVVEADGANLLHKIEGIINQYMHKDILKEHLPNCMQDMPFAVEEIVFQHDPDPKHTAKSVTN